MSKCKNGQHGLHNWEIIEDNERELAEVCINCGEKRYQRKENGRIDNEKYIEDHQRDFIQKNDVRFNDIYKKQQ